MVAKYERNIENTFPCNSIFRKMASIVHCILLLPSANPKAGSLRKQLFNLFFLVACSQFTSIVFTSSLVTSKALELTQMFSLPYLDNMETLGNGHCPNLKLTLINSSEAR